MAARRETQGWVGFFNELSLFLRTAKHTEHPSRGFCEYVVDRLQMWIVSVAHLVTHLESRSASNVAVVYVSCLNELIEHLRAVLNVWNSKLEDYNDGQNPYSYSVQVETPHRTGRPRFMISKEQIEYLRSMSFTWVQISDLLGVSYMTIYRRRVEYGIIDNRGRDVSDADILRLVSELRREQPALGQTMVWARLKALGFKVTRARVRDAIHSTDPISSAFRWREMTPRRPYSVASPNSLWHIGISLNQLSKCMGSLTICKKLDKLFKQFFSLDGILYSLIIVVSSPSCCQFNISLQNLRIMREASNSTAHSYHYVVCMYVCQFSRPFT